MTQTRPVSKHLGGLRTKLWFDVISCGLGGKTPGWFWKTFDEGTGDRSTWERYKRGQRDATSQNGRDRVALVEQDCPGSAIYHRSAIWTVLSGSILTIDELVVEIEALGGAIQSIVLAGDGSRSLGGSSIGRLFANLEQLPDFKTLSALILMLAWADQLQNVALWNTLGDFYRHMIPAFIERGEIPFYDEVFDAVDDYARTREFTKLNVRHDRFTSWREQLPRCQQMIEDQEELERLEFALTPRTFIG